MPRFLGIDTSNYFTSAALFDGGSGEYIKKSTPLLVKSGERGLRQSDAQFMHLQNLPPLIDGILSGTDIASLSAIGVSSRPRNIEGSYMPCFLQGVFAGRMLAKGLNIPCYEFSHQEGHLAAGIMSVSRFDLLKKAFLAVHLSGGTSEILHVRGEGSSLIIDKIGGTKDINAGQLIDRIGVKMGFPFPSGKYLDKISKGISFDDNISLSLDGAYFNLSGYENIANALYAKTNDKGLVAAFIFKAIAIVLRSALERAVQTYGCKEILLVGGVASNSHIRKELESFDGALFAKTELCADNAVGPAVLASLKKEGI